MCRILDLLGLKYGEEFTIKTCNPTTMFRFEKRNDGYPTLVTGYGSFKLFIPGLIINIIENPDLIIKL